MLEKPKPKFRPAVKIAGFVALFLMFAAVALLAQSMGWLERKDAVTAEGAVPKTDLPTYAAPAAAPAAADAKVDMPGATPGCTQLLPVKFQHWAWNAQMGQWFAVGGKQSTAGSLMCKHGVNLLAERQDWPDKMQEALMAFATAYKGGEDNPQVGTHFVSIMGDAAAQFFAALNPKLQRIGGPDYRAVIVGSAGRSLGEDKCMGPVAWKDSPQNMRGKLIAGVCKDGDWNICVKFALDNGVQVNPDPTVWDPGKLNFMCTPGYMEAATAVIANTCADLREKGTGNTVKKCAEGAATWTPGDVEIARKKGGVVSLASTLEYAGQMPNIIIGFNPWMKKHPAIVEGMLTAIFEGSEAVTQSQAALNRAAQISDVVYGEKETGPDYWKRYFLGVEERDKAGLTIRLGGSKVHTLADNAALFGLVSGFANEYEATYRVFGDIVKYHFPKDVPSYPPIREVLDTSYLQAVVAKMGHDVMPTVQTASYSEVAASATKTEIGNRQWSITFNTGQATFTSQAEPVLQELMQGLVVAGNTAIEIHGHTDSQGNADANMQLSEARAFAVKQTLQQRAPANFPETRFKVFAHGQTQPVAPNATDVGRAQNRRVQVVLLSK